MKHERIVEAIMDLNNKIDKLEGFVSRIADDTPTDLKGEGSVESKRMSMSQFLSGGGLEMVQLATQNVITIHERLSDLLEGKRKKEDLYLFKS